MNASVVVTSLVPVVLMIGVGFFAGRRGWVSSAGAKELAELSFMVLAPALLFRTMSQVHVEQLDGAPVALYFGVAIALFVFLLLVQGVNRRSTVLAMAATFSNTVMMGIPLVTLAFGPPGLVYLFTLVSLHALILLTLGTIVLELSLVREQSRAKDGVTRHPLATVLLAMRNAIIHPVPLPIILGLLFAQTGWAIPDVLDKPLQWLGTAFGPLALLMVGITLHGVLGGVNSDATQPQSPAIPWRVAALIALLKNLVHPLVVLVVGSLIGLQGLALAVMVVAAAMPIGANVFMFSQRYGVAQDEVTTSVAVSTFGALLSVPLVITLLSLLQ